MGIVDDCGYCGCSVGIVDVVWLFWICCGYSVVFVVVV